MIEPVRLWIPMADGSVSMVDASDVVSITARKVQGAWRDLPGGRREQGTASYDVTFRFRSGATDRVTLSEPTWAEVRAAIEKGVAP